MVIAYVVTIGYFLLAAISPQADVIPSTWPEFARVGVLLAVIATGYAWGVVRTWDGTSSIPFRGSEDPE